VPLDRLLAERSSCYETAREINAKRVILSRAIRRPNLLLGFNELLLEDLEALTKQLKGVLDRSRRLTLEITLERE